MSLKIYFLLDHSKSQKTTATQAYEEKEHVTITKSNVQLVADWLNGQQR